MPPSSARFTPADGFALPHFNLGVIYEKRGDVRAAVEQYERAIKLEPRYFKAQFNLGRIYAASGRRGAGAGSSGRRASCPTPTSSRGTTTWPSC